MDVKDIISSVAERIKETANVRVVFGDPITADNITIVPVACVKVAGGGGGSDKKSTKDRPDEDGSGGLGLGLQVVSTPIGYIEVRDGEARFVDIVDKNKLAVGGIIVGGLLVLSLTKLVTWKIKHR